MVWANDAKSVVANFDIEIKERNQLAVSRYSRHHGRPILRLVQHGTDGIFQPVLSADSAHYRQRLSIRPPVRAAYTFQHLSRGAATKRHAGKGADVLAAQQNCHFPTL